MKQISFNSLLKKVKRKDELSCKCALIKSNSDEYLVGSYSKVNDDTEKLNFIWFVRHVRLALDKLLCFEDEK